MHSHEPPVTDDQYKLANLEKLVNEFENCTLNPASFHHIDHLTIALWYQAHHSNLDISYKFRTGLLRLAEHFQLTVYHETITMFWIKLVHSFYQKRRIEGGLSDLMDELSLCYADHKIIYDYYSEDVLMSDEARVRWIEPNLKHLK